MNDEGLEENCPFQWRKSEELNPISRFQRVVDLMACARCESGRRARAIGIAVNILAATYRRCSNPKTSAA